MNRRLSTRVLSISLATFVTLAVLLGLNGLASPEHAAPQLARTVAAQPA
jgi:hypothetical protein